MTLGDQDPLQLLLPQASPAQSLAEKIAADDHEGQDARPQRREEDPRVPVIEALVAQHARGNPDIADFQVFLESIGAHANSVDLDAPGPRRPLRHG